MREVVVIGVGMHKFGRFPDKRVKDLGRKAVESALDDAGVPFKDIQAAYVGHVYQPMGTGADVVTQFGQTGIPVSNMEVACTSSTQGLIRAYWEIASGLYDVVLAVGVEKMQRGLLAGTSAAGSYEEVMGLKVMPAVYAMRTKRHMHDYGTTLRQVALCSVKEHKNGCLNPYAQYQTPCTVEEVTASKMIADPITLFMCSPTSDGASAAVLCSRDMARKYTSKTPVTIASWAFASDLYTRQEGESEFAGVEILAERAYEMAGIGPEDVDVAQVHDAFSPGEIFLPEALGLIPKGEGGPWVEEGRTDIEGDLPINTDGGLVSRGHPVGATGLAQVAELVWQLRGEAGPRQVPGSPKVALQHNSGIGGVCVNLFKI
jgi:acetyl-CoA acetyltransferase